MSISHNSTADIISDLLNITRGSEWDITSKDGERDLYMVHYSEKLAAIGVLDLDRYKKIKGIVVDTACGTVVCANYDNQYETVSDKLETTPDKKYYKFSDSVNGAIYTIPIEETQLHEGYEGVELRIWKDSLGKAHISTNKKIDLSNSDSRGYCPLSYYEYYKMLNGPAAESFFDPNKYNYPYVHRLMMVHTDILLVSKEIIIANIGGYNVSLGD